MSESRRHTSRWMRVAAVTGAVALAATACGSGESGDQAGASGEETTTPADAPTDQESSEPDEATGDPITVGIVTSTSGFLSTYGATYLEGLEAGLAYATDGTGAVDGRPIEFEISDDGGEPEKAISAATDLVGRGVSIIAGTVSSGVAIQMAPFAEENGFLYISGPAASDAITGVNSHTFRAGRQTYQDVATAATLIDEIAGADVLVLAQDSAFGEGNVAAVEAVLGGQGANVDSLLVPTTSTEFTPNAQQVLDADPDLLFVAWAGDTTPAMWQALTQQGVFEATTVTTGLGDVASYTAYGQDPTGIEFLSHFAPGTLDNPVANAMEQTVSQADLFTPDGFVTAQMIVRALSEAGPDDVDGMIAALEGWTFDAPKGSQTIRASDHAMIQPMFTVSLAAGGDPSAVQLLDTIDADAVAPPEA